MELKRLVIALIKLYQALISPWSGPSCRFIPSCSQYAVEAVDKYGITRGLWMSLARIARCRPGGGYGYDPVP